LHSVASARRICDHTTGVPRKFYARQPTVCAPFVSGGARKRDMASGLCGYRRGLRSQHVVRAVWAACPATLFIRIAQARSHAVPVTQQSQESSLVKLPRKRARNRLHDRRLLVETLYRRPINSSVCRLSAPFVAGERLELLLFCGSASVHVELTISAPRLTPQMATRLPRLAPHLASCLACLTSHAAS
jgi:hypothetical protein